MILNKVDGQDYVSLVVAGARSLANDVDRINALNVFPVPDGDTGTNMKMTIEGGASSGLGMKETNLGIISKNMARSMVLSARGNSGVITSQFFKGLSIGFEGKESVDVKGFAEAMLEGTKKSYSVVQIPTEGTILTVMREAGEAAYKALTDSMTLPEYLRIYLEAAKVSLEHTPELLAVLKEAGVIDSGGAGFCLIIEGMLKASLGEEVLASKDSTINVVDHSGFNADSELTWGYCTEFILQLQNSKVDIPNFDLKIIQDYLETIGNSIVSFKDEDLVKVHVHTFDPGLVLTEMRKYGEFITIKIENMNVQHTENNEIIASSQEVEEKPLEHKKYASVAVANGEGLVRSFKEMGVDEVVTGGQTMNTSTEDFLNAFRKIDAEYILVFPNNGNIVMAAKQAAENYDKAKVYVVPTKTIAEGYSAVSMLNYEIDDIDEIVKTEIEVIKNVSTLEVTYSIRDTAMNGIKIKKGDYICIYNGNLIASDKDRVTAVKKSLKKISDFGDKQVMSILCGQDVKIEECDAIREFAETLNSYIEVYPLKGNQDIYSYIIGIE
ncbi:MAG: DAK2 domain-containing protein [Acholeplasmatales bacterium]|nr:DAK2 domain-containing protein [Acholeplasmatales bacterium]